MSGLLLILFAELGDKTFFLALLLALRNPKGAVFAGTFGALAVMTGISVGFGVALHGADEAVVAAGFGAPGGVPWDDVVSIVLLTVFGLQQLASAEGFTDQAGGGPPFLPASIYPSIYIYIYIYISLSLSLSLSLFLFL